MRTLQVIANLYCQSGGKRIAAMGAIAMLVSASADAAPHRPIIDTTPKKPAAAAQDLYSRYYRTIVSDDNFRAHYQQWRRGFPGFNWHTNGCSWPASLTHYADNFYWPCVQHDFGYGNSRMVHQHNEATRKFIDVNLLRHTRQLCSHYGVLAKPGCYVAAGTFYVAVRNGGKSHF